MIMSVEMLALMIEGERIDELEQIEKIYISYAGVMNLQSSLWQMEDRLARSTNYWIMQADNVELFAPSLIGICTWLDEHPEIDINPIELEATQCIVFAEERREELEQKNLVVVNVSNSNSKKLGFYRCNGRKKKDVRKMGGVEL